jgi:hypothetical protein
MKMHATWLLAILLALPATGACATTDDRISGPELVQALQDAGYKAKLDTDDAGDPLVHTSMNGLDVTVFTYDCQQHRCGSLQLSVGIDLTHGTTAAVVNQFNHDYRYARAFLDEENDPFLRYDFEILNTRHEAYIASQLDSWEQVLGAFTDAVGYRQDDAPPAAPTGHVLGMRRDVAR